MQLALANLDYVTQKRLGQCMNRDKTKEFFYNSPYLLKSIPEFVDAEMITECWKYYKNTKTTLSSEPLKRETLEHIIQGPDNPLVKFYTNKLEEVFSMFADAVQYHKKLIEDKTSVVLRFTINRIKSQEVIICIVPGGRWWVLCIPTDVNKMGNWMMELANNNHFGRCMMVSIYKVTHTENLSVSSVENNVKE